MVAGGSTSLASQGEMGVLYRVPLPGRHRGSKRSGWRCARSGPGGTSRGRGGEAGEELRLLKEGTVGMEIGHRIDILWQRMASSDGMLRLVYI